MSEEALLLAREDIIAAIWDQLPQLPYEEVAAKAEAILSKIDWDNAALMHKGMAWITQFYLARGR